MIDAYANFVATCDTCGIRDFLGEYNNLVNTTVKVIELIGSSGASVVNDFINGSGNFEVITQGDKIIFVFTIHF